MRRQLTFLIGAHKTASTHLQRSLTASRDAVRNHGVGIIGPMPIGADILPLSGLVRGRSDPDLLALSADGFLEKHITDAPQAVLMNENIVGSLTPNMLLQDNLLYKFSPGRLKRVLQLFPGHDLRVGMAIRNPADFLVSAWQENMKGHAFQPFTAYLDGVDAAALSWHVMVKKMRQTIGNVPIFLWCYEDYPDVARAVLRHVMGDTADHVTLLPDAVNPGFSAAALDYLAQVGVVTTETSAEAMRRFPKGQEFAAYMPWSTSEKQALSDAYDASLARLANMEGVTLIRP